MQLVLQSVHALGASLRTDSAQGAHCKELKAPAGPGGPKAGSAQSCRWVIADLETSAHLTSKAMPRRRGNARFAPRGLSIREVPGTMQSCLALLSLMHMPQFRAHVACPRRMLSSSFGFCVTVRASPASQGSLRRSEGKMTPPMHNACALALKPCWLPTAEQLPVWQPGPALP